MADEGIVIPVRLDDEEARRMWAQLQERFKNTPSPTVPKPGAPDDPIGFFGNLREKLMAYRREEVQQARLTSFFAQQFGGLGQAVGISSGAIRTFTALAAQGFGIGLGIEVLRLGVSHFMELAAAAKKAKEEAQAAVVALLEQTARTEAALARLGGDEVGASRIETERKLTVNLDERKKVTAELAKLEVELAGIQAARAEAGVLGGELSAISQERLNKLTSDSIRLEQQRMEITAEASRSVLTGLQAAERAAADLVKSEEERNARARAEMKRRLDLQAEHARGLRELLQKGEDEETKSQLDRARKFYEYLTDRARLQEAGGNEELAALRKERDARLAIVEGHADLELEIRRQYSDKEVALVRRQGSQEEAILRHVQVAAGAYAIQSYQSFKKLADLKGKGAQDEKAQQEALMGGLDMLGAAVQEFTKGNIEAMAKQAAVEGIVNTAKGLAALALSFFGVPSAAAAATAYFSAAAMNFAVAGIAAGIGAMMGGGGGASAPAPAGATATGPETYTPGGRDAGLRGGGEPTNRTTVIFMGAYMSEAEAARYLARGMERVERMGLLREG
jgi:hypothetical protein